MTRIRNRTNDAIGLAILYVGIGLSVGVGVATIVLIWRVSTWFANANCGPG